MNRNGLSSHCLSCHSLYIPVTDEAFIKAFQSWADYSGKFGFHSDM